MQLECFQNHLAQISVNPKRLSSGRCFHFINQYFDNNAEAVLEERYWKYFFWVDRGMFVNLLPRANDLWEEITLSLHLLIGICLFAANGDASNITRCNHLQHYWLVMYFVKCSVTQIYSSRQLSVGRGMVLAIMTRICKTAVSVDHVCSMEPGIYLTTTELILTVTVYFVNPALWLR